MEIILAYDTFKSLVNNKDLVWNYIESDNKYDIYSSENNIIYRTEIFKSCTNIVGIDESENSTNKTDFETNYKPTANSQNSLLLSPFTKNSVQLNAHGVYATVTKNTIQNIDLKIEHDNVLVHGAMFYAKDAVFGDHVKAKVVDVDNILGYGAGTVLSKWIEKWYIVPNTLLKVTQDSAADILNGLYLRIQYTSVGTTNNVEVICNYYLSIK